MDVRNGIVSWLNWGADNEPLIHYSQDLNLRMAAVHTPGALPLETDCSGFYTLCCAWAGAPDPNGNDYDGHGFTGTVRAHCPQISLRDAQPGDPIVYGPGTGTHMVGIVSGAGTANPIVVSHGQERGPFQVRHSVEVASHSGGFTVHRVVEANAQPQPIPTKPPAPVEEPMNAVLIRNPDTGEIRAATLMGTWHVLDSVTELPLVEYALLHSSQVNDVIGKDGKFDPVQWQAWMDLPNLDSLLPKGP